MRTPHVTDKKIKQLDDFINVCVAPSFIMLPLTALITYHEVGRDAASYVLGAYVCHLVLASIYIFFIRKYKGLTCSNCLSVDSVLSIHYSGQRRRICVICDNFIGISPDLSKRPRFYAQEQNKRTLVKSYSCFKCPSRETCSFRGTRKGIRKEMQKRPKRYVVEVSR